MKFIDWILLPFFAACLLISCGEAPQQSATTQTVVVQKADDEDDLLVSLAADLVANPRTQAERDNNAILNYLMDEGIAMQRTPSGFYYQIIEPGAGDLIEWGDWLSVHYRGYTLDGKEVDSSYKKGKPLDFYVGNMVPGWNEGLQLLRPGSKAFFVLPSHLAYGEKGYPNVIPPHTVLAFELEILSVEKR